MSVQDRPATLPRVTLPNTFTARPRAAPAIAGPKMQLSGVSVQYGTFRAVRDINLTVLPQAVTAFIGPSGCGKSTILRCLNRMNDLVPGARVTGTVTLDDTDIYGRDVDPVDVRRHVGLIFQRPNPFPMTIYDNVAYGPRRRGMKGGPTLDALVERSLKQAALWQEVQHDFRRKSGLALSGGQQQRLCIARALAVGPEVLLLDEPCSALDPIATTKVEHLIHELKENYTVVIVTHNLAQATRVADHTAFFYLGKLVEFGTTQTIFHHPAEKLTENYVTGLFG